MRTPPKKKENNFLKDRLDENQSYALDIAAEPLFLLDKIRFPRRFSFALWLGTTQNTLNMSVRRPL